MTVRRPRAPVRWCSASAAHASIASGVKTRSTPSIAKKRWNHREEALELAHERVLRLGEDANHRLLVERLERDHHRHAADELGDKAVLEQVVVRDLREQFVRLLVRVDLAGAGVGAEADRPATLAEAAVDNLVETLEGATADEEDVGGVDLDEVLVRVLASALGRYAGDAALDDLEERLLDTLAGDIARDRGVVGLAGDLVDLVDVDDAALGPLNIEVGGLDQVEEDVLDILAHVAGLGEGGGVGDREGNVERLGERAGEQRLAGAGGTNEQDVALLELDIAAAHVGGVDPLVVVVDRDGQHLLGLVLPDHVFVEMFLDLLGRWHPLRGTGTRTRLRRGLLIDDLAAELDTLVTDVDGSGTGDQTFDLVLVLSTERAVILDASGSIRRRH
jgi:hypothetical protein